MTGFVLDNSVTMRWLLTSPKAIDRKYAERVLISLENVDAIVPDLWHLDVCNVVSGAEKRGDIKSGVNEGFICQLETLPIHVDQQTAHQTFFRIMGLARTYKLRSYDAAYLELSMRTGLPLATLDKELTKAITKAKPGLYLR